MKAKSANRIKRLGDREACCALCSRESSSGDDILFFKGKTGAHICVLCVINAYGTILVSHDDIKYAVKAGVR
jgi:hypothetical protein